MNCMQCVNENSGFSIFVLIRPSHEVHLHAIILWSRALSGYAQRTQRIKAACISRVVILQVYYVQVVYPCVELYIENPILLSSIMTADFGPPGFENTEFLFPVPNMTQQWQY